MLNMSMSELPFAVPEIAGRTWAKAIDTAAPSPQDAPAPKERERISGERYSVPPHAIVVLTTQEGKNR
jgi:hypothetical protein